jgi:organic hydroperoxide reductase OsmC/OhrA
MLVYISPLESIKLNPMSHKTDKPHLFEVQLNWLTGKRGILSAKDAKGTLHVATPPAFGGEGKPWTPEHLFLSSISSCFMTTYIALAPKFRLEFCSLECNAIGQVQMVDGKYKFTQVNLYPIITVASEEWKSVAETVLEKTIKYCLITNSIAVPVYYHSKVDLLTRNNDDGDITGPRKFTIEEAREIGNRIGVNFSQYDVDEFRRGLEVEMEHGTVIHETNVTNDDENLTGKIAWAHLHEIPDYYTRLDKMEEEAQKIETLYDNQI